MQYTYKGRRVSIPPAADIVANMRPNGRHAHLVQEVLDSTDPWLKGESPIEEMECSENILPRAVCVPQDIEVTWGIHLGHKAREPQLSPFVDVNELEIEFRGSVIVVVLHGTPRRPMIVQAYPGDPETGGYIPALPWMISAKNAEGGEKACREYWRTHAFLSRDLRLIKEKTRTTRPPEWYRG